MKPSFGLRRRGAIAGALVLISLCVRAEPPAPPPMSPSQILSTHLHGDAPDALKAKTLLIEWLEAKRNSEAYEDNHDSNYENAARIIQAADGPAAVGPFLERELALTTSRRSRYALQKQMAQLAHDDKNADLAIAHWELARAAVMDGQHPYYTTRQALPLMEIGRLLLELGRNEDARQRFAQYVASDYGQKEANGVIALLGDLYEESGEWEKARALYEHYAQFPYYKNDAELQKRLGIPSEDARAQAMAWLAELQNANPVARRKARLRLYELLSASKNRDPWLRWLDQTSATETNSAARVELEMLLPLLTPLADVPDPARSDNAQERMRRMDQDRQRFQAHESVLESLFSSRTNRELSSTLQQILIGTRPLRELAFTPEFRDSLETEYAATRQRLLRTDDVSTANSSSSSSDAGKTAEDLRVILQDNPTLRDFLKTCVSLQSPQLGQAPLFLFALGIKEDIGFLINQIPDDPYLRNRVLLPLAMALERERLVDLPRVLGIDQRHVRNWWDVLDAGSAVRETIQSWWNAESNAFDYIRSPAQGRRVYGPGFTSRITAVAPAPELDGVFFLEEGGFLDYSGSVGFFHFPSGECGPLTRRMRGETNGIFAQAGEHWTQSGFQISILSHLAWNPNLLRCEFNVSGDKRVGISFATEPLALATIAEIPLSPIEFPKEPSLGPGIRRHGDFTFEIRRGDLFVVHEPTGKEECLDDFGYYLSFTLNRDATQILASAREIPGQAWILIERKPAPNLGP